MTSALAMAGKKPAREYFDMICNARDGSALGAAREKYVAACKKLPLGQQIEIAERKDGTGYVLVATSLISRGRPITAFAADAAVMHMQGSQKKEHEPVFKGSLGAGDPRWVRACGPFADSCAAQANNARFANAMAFTSAPVVGFPPIVAVVSDQESDPTPDLAGIWVAGVVDSNPFEDLKQDDDALPTWAQIAVDYLRVVRGESNVRVAVERGMPPVVLALRDIQPGEILKTGRPPSFWMDAEFAQKVIDVVMTHQTAVLDEIREAGAAVSRSDVEAMFFG